MLGTFGLEVFFKELVHRARPEIRHSHGWDSFPSGHTLAATILSGILLILFLPACRTRGQRGVVIAVACTWPLLTAASRVYLDAHYVTDVVGGLLLGMAWVSCCLSLLLVQIRARYGTQEAVQLAGD